MKIHPPFMTLVPALLFGLLALPAFAQTGNLANPAALSDKAPPVYKVRFDTSKGAFVIEVHRDWAPRGVDHFFNLIQTGFYNGVRFFRVTHSYVQFGINGNPSTNGLWSTAEALPLASR